MASRSLEEKIIQFIQENINIENPLLVALSGGGDSMCLFHLLYRAKKKLSIDLHIVHVDHGWREESSEERAYIQRLGHELSLPVHIKELSPHRYKGNWEQNARDERLLFFAELSKELQAEGIFVAHHSDDQKETIFKRLLEGSSLFYLSGMKEVKKMGNFSLFRPLLSFSKKDLLEWLQKEGCTFFEDATNFDEKYLRARMRLSIFPFLEKSFGKNFGGSLLEVGKEAGEMSAYIEAKIEPFLSLIEENKASIICDFSTHFPKERVECKALFRLIGERFGFVLNRRELHTACTLLLEGAANKYLLVREKKIIFDRRRLIIVKNKEKILLQSMPLSEGVFSCGTWSVRVKKGSGEVKNSWKDVCRGRVATTLPLDDYSLLPVYPHLRRSPLGRTMGRLLSDYKIPRAVSAFCPIIVGKEGVVEDFLIGIKPKESKKSLHITLERGCEEE